MNFDRAKEIIGDRTPEEIVFDKVVVKELKKGRSIIKALKMANKKYPDEALQWSDETIEDITLHYEYLMQHEDILKGFKRLSN
ncbi:MAG: hypothetical protein JXR48_17125 [Candidatus Delongbacteria bacterium]|nr:hypothetical protein [Candidatus Delongbacteria bacterium]